MYAHVNYSYFEICADINLLFQPREYPFLIDKGILNSIFLLLGWLMLHQTASAKLLNQSTFTIALSIYKNVVSFPTSYLTN